MKALLAGVALSTLLAQAALAQNVGVSMARFDDNFLTVIRLGMQDYAKTLDGVNLQVEDAQDDVSKQLNQIQNFVASGVAAIIVNPVDTDATQAMSDAAAAANIPLVYVNRQPINVDALPDNQAFVASDERESGTLETKEICRLLKEKGKGDGANIVVLMGQLSNQAAQQRTADVHDVIATDDCKFMKIVEEQTANWDRTEGADLMTNFLSSGAKFDAVVANNDEMAIGAIQALKAAGVGARQLCDRRRRCDAGRAGGDGGRRSRRHGLPGRGRAGQGRSRRGAGAGQGRSGGAEGLHPLPAGDAGQHGRLPGQELVRPA